jgi:hypothetical protein
VLFLNGKKLQNGSDKLQERPNLTALLIYYNTDRRNNFQVASKYCIKQGNIYAGGKGWYQLLAGLFQK